VAGHFTSLLGEMAIRALCLKISCYSRCVLTLLGFSPTLLRPIGHHQTLMSRPRAQTCRRCRVGINLLAFSSQATAITCPTRTILVRSQGLHARPPQQRF
jgi:hypothetical protein